ncbi:unnamed protein product [Vicia faba]|uniref:Uncharacterized protein n=1 Tax=Vicia faba TaxID=3906 RepID=A0AAV0ZE39_VICFA|nr:unnamed protein product [Vicia faba]
MDENSLATTKICVVCSNAGVYFNSCLFRATGLPTEFIFKVLVEKMGFPDIKSRNKTRDTQGAANNVMDCNIMKLGCSEWWNKRSKRVATLEFDRVRKSMSVIVRELDGQHRLLVKGVVESLLEQSLFMQLAEGSLVPIDDQCKGLLFQRLHEMSSKGLRCLGLACKDELGEFSNYSTDTHHAHKKLLDLTHYSSIESDFIFVDVVGLREPPREEVYKAIEDCKQTGIKVMVIAGDNKSTAEAICTKIRLFSGYADLTDQSLTGT